MRVAAALAVLLCLAAPTNAETAPRADTFAGSTVETAIVLPGIADEFHGVAAEHAYIAAHFPTWHIEYQAHLALNGRDYDLIGMLRPDRSQAPLYFDITPWFGK